MGVYDRLYDILAAKAETTGAWTVSFAELERLVGVKLPASAWKYPGWWSNNPSNNSMTKVWLKAGFKTEQVDISGMTVVFRRAAPDVRGFDDRPRDIDYAEEGSFERAPEIKAFLLSPESKSASGPRVTRGSGRATGGRAPRSIAARRAEMRRGDKKGAPEVGASLYPARPHLDLFGRTSVGDENPFENDEERTIAEAKLGRSVRFDDFYGALKGLVTVAPGADLTAPSDDEWDALKDE